MGLDMYLTAKSFIWTHTVEGKILQEKLKKVMDTDYPVQYVELEIGYWRKANQIHKWFVDNIQNGKDDCKEYEVSEDNLKELLETVNTALKSKNPENILPTEEGFFFGKTEYDEYYFQQLEHTRDIIEKYLNLKNKEEYDVYYSSSW